MTNINPEDYGITISGNRMDNGELRFRLTSDSSSYIRTESTEACEWQNSHYHTRQTEYYLIERGDVEFAIMEGENVVIRRCLPGDFFSVAPMMPHNMKLGEGCVVHTVKCGGAPDWIGVPEMDEELRYLKTE